MPKTEPYTTLPFTEDQMAAAGMAAMIPGMQLAINHLQAALDDMRLRLERQQQVAFPAPKPRGRPRKTTGSGSYWGKMSPEERKAEMARRVAVRVAKLRGRKKGRRPNRPRQALPTVALEKAS